MSLMSRLLTTDQLMRPLGSDENPGDLILEKHSEYYASARRFRLLYFATRLVGGLCAAVLPFVVYSVPLAATCLSIAIVVVTVFDSVFNPKERWKTTSRASDLLYVAELKRRGKYKEFEEMLNIILTAEDQQMLQLVGLDEVIRKAKTTAETQPSKPTT